MKGIVYRGLGIALIVLSIIGAIVPLLPSTPFVLLASGCFLRSSPQWNDLLLRSPIFGNALRDWQTNRCVRPFTKVIALGSIVVVSGANLIGGRHTGMFNAILIVTLLLAVVTLLLLPTTTNRRLTHKLP